MTAILPSFIVSSCSRLRSLSTRKFNTTHESMWNFPSCATNLEEPLGLRAAFQYASMQEHDSLLLITAFVTGEEINAWNKAGLCFLN